MSSRRKRGLDEAGGSGASSVSPSSSSSSTPLPSKRTRSHPNNNNADGIEQFRLCQEMLDSLRSERSEGDRQLCESFMRNPSKRTDPDFYKVVKRPMDIARIQQKLKMEEYSNLDDLVADLFLMVNNYLLYYKAETTEHSDAELLRKLIEEKKGILEAGGQLKKLNGELRVKKEVLHSPSPSHARSASPSSSNAAATSDSVDIEQVEDILCTILELTDDSKRLLSPPFRLLQTPEEFPSYYEKVKSPIDLKTIAEKTRAGCYSLISQLEEDFKLLCSNAKMFNEPESLIHKDANTLLQAFRKKKKEVMGKAVSPKRAEHCREAVDSLIAQALVVDNDTYSEDSEEDEEMESSEDPLWQLYWTVRNAPASPSNHENMLSDPFLELPSKHCYPDYFDEVSQPMSFFMVNSRLKRGEFHSLEELVDALLLIFDNACEYNMEGSDIHKAALKLRRLALNKACQLQPSFNLAKYAATTPESSPKIVKNNRARKIKEEMVDDEENRSPHPSTPSVSVDSTPTQAKKRWRKARPISTGMSPLPPPTGKPGRKSMDEMMLRFRVNLMTFFDVICNHREEKDYWPAGAFLELPKKEEHPAYYDVISNPIDLNSIKSKIEMNGYTSSTELMDDFSTCFSNARVYNDPKSRIYRDSKNLQKLVEEAHAKTKGTPFESPLRSRQRTGSTCAVESSPNPAHVSVPKPAAKKNAGSPIVVADSPRKGYVSTGSEEQKRMSQLLNELKDVRDERKRKLAAAFLKLPSKAEYPDYYEVIKKPIDFHKIQQKLSSQAYSSYSEIISDLQLMLDNACKYNEPESQIYKDAIQLQRVLLEKKRELVSDPEINISVQAEIRAIFTSLFVSVFSRKNLEGRCFSDGLADILELLKAKGISGEEWPFTLDQIKKNIDRNRYRRLDRLQLDFFALFEKARQVSRSDSQLFEDASELQIGFIEARDQLCKGVLISSAFERVQRNVEEEIEAEKRRKAAEEAGEEKNENDENEETIRKEGEEDVEECVVGEDTFRVADYALVAPSESSMKKCHVMRIERIFRDETGSLLVRGKWFYRPQETFHLATKKFLENEVFLTNFVGTVTSERLRGHCCVLFIKTFLRFRPKNMEESVVLACEERYLGNKLHFKKIKNWPFESDEGALELEERGEPLTLIRKPRPLVKAEPVEDREETVDSEEEALSQSAWSSRESADSEGESGSLDVAVSVLDVERSEVSVAELANDDGRIFFQQLLSNGKFFALGEFVLVFNPRRAFCDIMRIDRLWREKDGSAYFSGGCFARPSEVVHEPAQSFYRKEIFAVLQSDQTRRLEEIQSKCAVLTPKQFVRERPTHIPECDVFVCEKRVLGHGVCCASEGGPENGRVSVDSSLFLATLSADFSSRQMHLDSARHAPKFKSYSLASNIAHEEIFVFKTPITMEKEMSPLLNKPEETDLEMMDETAEADSADPVGAKELVSWLAHQPKLTAKSKSGYILFSAEIRKRIMHENPEAGFGEVSKIVGVEWKKLSEEQKKQYEVRAEYIANERAKQEAAAVANNKAIQPGQLRVYMCKWQNCDFQFDCSEGLYDHIVHYHTSQIIVDSEQQYVCMWLTCVRSRKEGKPFPSLPRLHRHMKEKHLTSSFKIIYGNQRAKNFYKYIISGGENGAQQTGQLVHFPYGMHPSQVAGLNSGQTTASAPPSTRSPMLNGHASGPAQHGQNGHHQSTLSVPHGQHMEGSSRINGYPGSHQMPHTPPHHYVNSMPGPAHGTPMLNGSAGAGPSGTAQVAPQPAPAIPAGPLPDARSLVTLSRQIEPVFVPPPNSIHARRVLHSETYLRYIESLSSGRQHAVSGYDRSLRAHRLNTQPNGARPMPTNWLRESGGEGAREEDVVRALWRLREQLLSDTLGVNVERQNLDLL